MFEPPDSQHDPEKPTSPFERDVLLFFYLTFAALILIGIFKDYEPAKLGIPFFVISWALLLALHEFGHALMARALGWKVELISLGFGRLRKKTTFLGMPLEIRSAPVMGFVAPRPCDLNYPRLKDFLIYAAGPGIELLAVGIAMILFGSDIFTRPTESIVLIAVRAFCLAALAGAIINLIPLPISNSQGTGGASGTDGLGMIQCWFRSDYYYASLIEQDPNP